jgi:hypothetical protein
VEIKQNRVVFVPASDRQPLLNPIDFYWNFSSMPWEVAIFWWASMYPATVSRVRVFDDATVFGPGAEDCSVWANIV